MQRISLFAHRWAGVLIALVCGAALGSAALIGVPSGAQARQGVAPLLAVPSDGEYWRVGITSEGVADYSAVMGRLAAASASFRSNRGTSDLYFIFPAPAQQRTLLAGRVLLTSSTGSYTSTANLTLEVRSFDGTLLHSATSAPVDLSTATVGNWAELSLSTTPSDLVLQPGQFLAVHLALGGAPSGDLDLRPIFEIEVQ